MENLETGAARTLPYLAMAAVVCGNVLGNVFLKLGSIAGTKSPYTFGIFGWQTLLGVGCFAAGLLIYAWALKFLPLHVAQAIAALQFVGAVLAAAFFFGEDINESKALITS